MTAKRNIVDIIEPANRPVWLGGSILFFYYTSQIFFW